LVATHLEVLARGDFAIERAPLSCIIRLRLLQSKPAVIVSYGVAVCLGS